MPTSVPDSADQRGSDYFEPDFFNGISRKLPFIPTDEQPAVHVPTP